MWHEDKGTAAVFSRRPLGRGGSVSDQGGRRRLGADRGIALLTVVVVLSTLLIIGVLFAITVDLDFKASKYYRAASQAELFALEGLYRATAEIQYDMWGVNEPQAFRLSNNAESLTYNGDGKPKTDAAYYRIVGVIDSDPGAGDDQPIIQAKSRWRQSVETIAHPDNPVNGLKVMTNYRWMVPASELDRPGEARDPYRELPPNPTNAQKLISTVQHSGMMYHDEFLPEGVDNHDLWEIGLHVNRGDVFFDGEAPRSFRNDEEGGLAKQYGVYKATYWSRRDPMPWDMEWDYVDTRLCGDSFYKIFRTELVYYDSGSGQWRSSAGGAQDRLAQTPGMPMRKDRRNWQLMKTHLGDAVGVGDYRGWGGRDHRGGALNINNVNSNYSFEIYHAQRTPDPTADWEPFHYRDSKWIYIYDEAGEVKRGRYAVLVVPDTGMPNANYQFNTADFLFGGWYDGTSQQMQNYLVLLDTAFTPRGGPSGLTGQTRLEGYKGADIIKSASGQTLKDVTGKIADHVVAYGTMTSRAELNMMLRKSGLPQGVVPAEVLDRDAEVISSMQSVWGYQPLLGPHWEHDRIVLDHLSDASSIKNSLPTRTLVWHTLNELKYYWGPDNGDGDPTQPAATRLYAREGVYTPYHYDAPGSLALPNPRDLNDEESKYAKATFFSWFAGAPRGVRNSSFTTRQGYKFDVDPSLLTYTEAPDLAAMTNAYDSFIWSRMISINEVGKISGIRAADLPGSPSGDLYFVEVITSGQVGCTWQDNNVDLNNVKLYVDGNVIQLPNIIAIGDAALPAPRNGTYGRAAGDPPVGTLVRDYGKFDYLKKPGSVPASHGRHLPANYGLFLFPADLAQDGSAIAITSGGVLLDYVKLPAGGTLSQGWSCYDYRVNQHPNMWKNTGNLYLEDGGMATPAWRGMSNRTDETGAMAWLHGLNSNFLHAFLPGAESYQPGYAVIDQEGHGSPSNPSVSGLLGTKRGEQSWVVSSKLAFENVSVAGPGLTMDHRGRMLSCPLGFFPRPLPVTHGIGMEPLLSSWGDLMRHAPIERYFVTGFLFFNIAKHGEYMIYDAMDNNLDGRIDNIVTAPRWPGAPLYVQAGAASGHFLGDGAAVGGVNLNEIFHPAALWYAGVGANNGTFRGAGHLQEGTDHMAMLGKKPFKGYTCWQDYRTRAHWGHYGNQAGHSVAELDFMSFAAGVWYENLYGDAGSNHTSFGGTQNHHHHDTRATSKNIWVGNSPVFSVYVTAQSLDHDGEPIAEIKVRATLERTWDGKTNFLDFKWIPSEGALLR